MTLNREQLKKMVEEKGLVQNFIDLETQLTPQGFDLTVDEIHKIEGAGSLDFSNGEREIPDSTPISSEKKDPEDEYGWWELEQGTYKIVMNEKVDIPNDLTGFAFPRSSLLRMGATIENAVWDAGFTGTGSFKLSVDNPEGIRIKENARVNQIVFEKIKETEEGYSGRYHE
ncbi:MAG: deoxyuridine 5'-triphosphate nucleotidohydrolase [Candidatus Nanohalobium sp.]